MRQFFDICIEEVIDLVEDQVLQVERLKARTKVSQYKADYNVLQTVGSYF
jgi:hypothetical protein